MELYFKELISEDASLEKLVDDLERVVQGVDDFARAIGVDLAASASTDVGRRLNRLKESCQRIKSEIVSKVRATDRLVRKKPHIFVAAAVVVGMVVGAAAGRRNR